MNWSSGKDAALVLQFIMGDPKLDLRKLVTSVSSPTDRVVMHGLRQELLEKQLEQIDIPSEIVSLPSSPSNKVYEQTMTELLVRLKSEGITRAAFGDIFLEDLRQYREQMLQKMGFSACFPLWKKPTKELVETFIFLGFKAIVICVDGSKLGPEFLGRTIDNQFLEDLPKDVDPCGENGEFHTFCYWAPYFRKEVRFSVGEIVHRKYSDSPEDRGFWFLDLLVA